MKKIAAEFKEFIMRGNVMDLAVGVIIGGAFQAIVNSLINDIISPLISLITGGIDFKNMLIPLAEVPEGVARTYEALTEAGVPVFAYGSFITAVINFLIMALIVFLIVKGINKLSNLTKKPEPEAEPTTKKCPHCCEEVNINATKCPHCTGDIPADKAEKAKKK